MATMSFTPALVAGGVCVAAQLILAGIFSCLKPGPWRTQPFYTAHQIISFTTMVYVAAVGARTWFYPDAALLQAATTTMTRLEHPHPVGNHLAQCLLGLNVLWDIPMGFISDSLRTRSNATLMLIHHLAVVLLTWLTIDPPRFHYYCGACHPLLARLANLTLVKNSRLSVQALTEREWEYLLDMAKA